MENTRKELRSVLYSLTDKKNHKKKDNGNGTRFQGYGLKTTNLDNHMNDGDLYPEFLSIWEPQREVRGE